MDNGVHCRKPPKWSAFNHTPDAGLFWCCVCGPTLLTPNYIADVGLDWCCVAGDSFSQPCLSRSTKETMITRKNICMTLVHMCTNALLCVCTIDTHTHTHTHTRTHAHTHNTTQQTHVSVQQLFPRMAL